MFPDEMGADAEDEGEQVSAVDRCHARRVRAMREAALATQPASTHPVEGPSAVQKPTLRVEDQLLLLLMYYREYRTFAHLGAKLRRQRGADLAH